MKKALSFFDVTNIVIGSVIGADIYIASALTAGMVGPFGIIVWIIAGVLAAVLALVLASCSSYVPKVGGPFAYVSEAFNDFWGFLAGWSLWIAEVIALPVFAIAFTNYLGYFVHLATYQEVLVKAGFLSFLTAVNIIGVKAAGILNDVLTILKLSPLILLVFAGIAYFANHPTTFQANYADFLPLGLDKLPTAIVLVFWAYVGFELSTIPASEVRDPQRTIPRAIITGIFVVAVFYLTTNVVVYGTINWRDLAQTTTPLVSSGEVVLGAFGATIMALGALVSVSGSNESDMLSSARLSYAMAVDGLFPKAFSRLHHRFGTPHVALVLQGLAAFGLSLHSSIKDLISFSVFNLGFAFLLTCLALIAFRRKYGRLRPGEVLLSWLGVAVCLYLLYSTSGFDKLAGGIVVLAGAMLYVVFSPKVDIHDLKALFIAETAMAARAVEREARFLGHFLRILHRGATKLR